MQATVEPTMTPRIPTWGRLNAKQAFNVLAQDLDRAIGFARLSPNETAFLQQVREACWGEAIRLGKRRDGAWPEALGCRINLTALAKATGINRQQWSVAKRDLVASLILAEDEDGTLRINKQADAWIYPKTREPRLTPRLVAFCRAVQPDDPSAAQARFEFARERVNPRSRHQTTVATGPVDFEAPRRNSDAPRVEGRTAVRAEPDAPRVEGRTAPASELGRTPAGPIEERPRGVLDPAEKERGGVEAQPPAPDSNFVPGRVEPWASPEAGQDYRSLARAGSEPAAAGPRAVAASAGREVRAIGRPRTPARPVGRESPPAVPFNPVGLVARLRAKGLLPTEGRRP